MADGRVHATPADIATLRERLNLTAAHAMQLLVLADGSANDAIALYEPNMFAVPQHALLQGDLQVGAHENEDGAPVDAGVVPAAAMPAAHEHAHVPAHVHVPMPAQSVAPAAHAEDKPKHQRSSKALALRKQRRKQRKQQAAQQQAAADVMPEPSGGSSHSSRLQRAEAVGFARGVAAEKAKAKERRGRKRIDKAKQKAHKRAASRIARKRRAEAL